jgi:riboflavin synthase
MFTGLVEDLGRLEAREDGAEGTRLRVRTRLGAELKPGDSIAVNGTCLTATVADAEGFTADVMNQTLAVTALNGLAAGDQVNLELAARLGDRLGGHLVQGHVDGVGEVIEVRPDGFAKRLRVAVPRELAAYMIEHGSVALNGVSLTISDLSPLSEEPTWIEVSLIPETQERTNLGSAEAGTRLNVECDMIARYAERLNEARASSTERDKETRPWKPDQ